MGTFCVWIGARPQNRMERDLLRSDKHGAGDREHCLTYTFNRLKSSFL